MEWPVIPGSETARVEEGIRAERRRRYDENARAQYRKMIDEVCYPDKARVPDQFSLVDPKGVAKVTTNEGDVFMVDPNAIRGMTIGESFRGMNR